MAEVMADGLQIWDDERGWVDVDEFFRGASSLTAGLFTSDGAAPLRRIGDARVVAVRRLTRLDRLRGRLSSWLSRLAGVHSPSAHAVGQCWCQVRAGMPTLVESFGKGFTDSMRAMNPAVGDLDDGNTYVVQEKTNPTDAASADSDSPSL